MIKTGRQPSIGIFNEPYALRVFPNLAMTPGAGRILWTDLDLNKIANHFGDLLRRWALENLDDFDLLLHYSTIGSWLCRSMSFTNTIE